MFILIGTRIQQRTTAPDSLAVFLCLKNGMDTRTCKGRVERRNTIPRSGNRPGASVEALVETRLPATNWESFTTKIQQDIVIMRDSHPSCALIVPLEDIVTCVKASRTLVSITQYHLTRTTLPDGGEETLVAAIDKYSALAESLQALIDQHEEACNEL